MFIIKKYEKVRFNNKESAYYVLSTIGEKTKNITKIEQKRLFLFTILISLFMALHFLRLIYTRNIWFNFVFGSFFKQDHQ